MAWSRAASAGPGDSCEGVRTPTMPSPHVLPGVVGLEPHTRVGCRITISSFLIEKSSHVHKQSEAFQDHGCTESQSLGAV